MNSKFPVRFFLPFLTMSMKPRIIRIIRALMKNSKLEDKKTTTKQKKERSWRENKTSKIYYSP